MADGLTARRAASPPGSPGRCLDQHEGAAVRDASHIDPSDMDWHARTEAPHHGCELAGRRHPPAGYCRDDVPRDKARAFSGRPAQLADDERARPDRGDLIGNPGVEVIGEADARRRLDREPRASLILTRLQVALQTRALYLAGGVGGH